jgi:hypothetical protein
MSVLLSPIFSLQQNQRTREQNRFFLKTAGVFWGEVAQTMYTHLTKCKNDKIKRERKKCTYVGYIHPKSPPFWS